MEIWVNEVCILDKDIVQVQHENSSNDYWIILESGFAIKVSDVEHKIIIAGTTGD